MFGLRALLAYFSRLSAGDALRITPLSFYRLDEVKSVHLEEAQETCRPEKVCLLLISQVAGYYTISQHLSKFLTSWKLLTFSAVFKRPRNFYFLTVDSVTNFLSFFTLNLRINPPLWVIMKGSKKPGKIGISKIESPKFPTFLE